MLQTNRQLHTGKHFKNREQYAGCTGRHTVRLQATTLQHTDQTHTIIKKKIYWISGCSASYSYPSWQLHIMSYIIQYWTKPCHCSKCCCSLFLKCLSVCSCLFVCNILVPRKFFSSIFLLIPSLIGQ